MQVLLKLFRDTYSKVSNFIHDAIWQEKLDFNNIATDNQRDAAEYLQTSDLLHLAMASKTHRPLFMPLVDVRKLLHCVVRGQYEKVKSILQNDISLIFQRGSVTDCSGRSFDNISAIEYVLWAKDKHMWTCMLDCLPKNEEGKKVLTRLLSQYNKVQTEGVTYRFNGKIITEINFDFENTIIKELQELVDLINAPGDKNWDAINEQWRTKVGGAQKLLPIHVVNEYRSDQPFSPEVPQFTSPPEVVRPCYNEITRSYDDWDEIYRGLAVDFALYKGPDEWGTCSKSAGGFRNNLVLRLSRLTADLAALKELWEVRTQNVINFKSQLEELIADINSQLIKCEQLDSMSMNTPAA